MKVGDKVKVVASELQGVITELFPAVDDWKETAMVSFPNGKQVEYELIDLETEEKECHYCGDNCPNEPEDSEYLCDGFAGDIDGLYAEDTQAAVEDYVFWREAIEGVK